MKKHLIAAAVAAAVAAPAMAQNVTLYGNLDTSVFNINKATATQNVSLGYIDGNLASSIWGMRGSEDLGGGLRAVFDLQSDVATNNGGLNPAGLFRRSAYAGVASAQVGELTFGIRMNPLIAANAAALPLAGNAVTSNTSTSVGYADFFTRNALTYTSPAINGVTLQGQYGAANTPGQTTAGSVTAWRLSYSGGPLALQLAGQSREAAAYASNAISAANPPAPGSTVFGTATEQLYNSVTGLLAGTDPGRTNRASVGKNTVLASIRYDLTKDLTIGVATVRNEVYNLDGVANSAGTASLTIPQTAGLTTKVNATMVGASYRLSPATVTGLSIVTAEGSRLINGQVRYSLSKRTTAYGMYAAAQNDSNATVRFFPVGTNTGTGPAPNLGGGGSGLAGVANTTQTAIGGGIIHSF